MRKIVFFALLTLSFLLYPNPYTLTPVSAQSCTIVYYWCDGNGCGGRQSYNPCGAMGPCEAYACPNTTPIPPPTPAPVVPVPTAPPAAPAGCPGTCTDGAGNYPGGHCNYANYWGLGYCGAPYGYCSAGCGPVAPPTPAPTATPAPLPPNVDSCARRGGVCTTAAGVAADGRTCSNIGYFGLGLPDCTGSYGQCSASCTAAPTPTPAPGGGGTGGSSCPDACFSDDLRTNVGRNTSGVCDSGYSSISHFCNAVGQVQSCGGVSYTCVTLGRWSQTANLPTPTPAPVNYGYCIAPPPPPAFPPPPPPPPPPPGGTAQVAPFIQTSGGDVHSNTNINTPGGP